MSTVREQPRLRTRILPPNLEQEKTGVTVPSPKKESLPLDEHLPGINVNEQPILFQPMAELHLAKDSGHKKKHYFGHLSGEIRGEKLYEDGIGGLGKVDQEVDLLHLFFHVGQRQDAEGRGVVHPDKVVVIRTVLGQ